MRGPTGACKTVQPRNTTRIARVSHHTHVAPALLAALPDAHVPHIPVRISSSTYRQPPGSCPESKDIARTVLRGAPAAHRQSVRTSASCPGGCSAPGAAASPNYLGPAFGSLQRPRAREGAVAAAMRICRSSTGHTCVTKKWSAHLLAREYRADGRRGDGDFERADLAYMKAGQWSCRRAPDRLADDGHAAEALDAQMCMAGPLQLSRSGGPLQRFGARHVGRTPNAGPLVPSANTAGITAIEGRTCAA